MDAISVLEPLYLSQSGFGLWLLVIISGIVFLTMGIVGIGRQSYENHRNLVTVLVVLLAPLLLLATVFASVLMVPLGFTFRVRDEVTQVDVLSNDPLVLFLGLKAITSRDSRIDRVYILDSNSTLIAEYPLDEHGYPYDYYMPICVLSGGSSVKLTLRFNCTLPKGNYAIFPATGGFGDDNHGHASFTIP
jgi:hypothetical protein